MDKGIKGTCMRCWGRGSSVDYDSQDMTNWEEMKYELLRDM